MAVQSGCDPCSEAAHVVETYLADIGIQIEIRTVNLVGKLSESTAKVDLLDAEAGLPYPDSASFLRQLLRATPSGWIPPIIRAKIERVDHLGGEARQRSAAALADRLSANEVPVAAYATPHASQFVGPRIGCRMFTPFGYGLDLAAICINP